MNPQDAFQPTFRPPPPVRLVPVLDLLGGRVVRAVGGRRGEYQPLRSPLSDDPSPAALARALTRRFPVGELYAADLDAIAGARPELSLYETLRSAAAVNLWVDAGAADEADAFRLVCAGVHAVVGLETVAGPAAWRRIARAVPAERLVFSLDLKAGKPLGTVEAWGTADPLTLGLKAADEAAQVTTAGLTRLIVLDLARVGENGGVGTELLCERLSRRLPGVEVFAGGGVRGPADLTRLAACGVAGVLVSTALHDGSLTPAHFGSEQEGGR
jgi:phosphoribosylformimino-5-aminoimidazole carboxamide ribotide isomerase